MCRVRGVVCRVCCVCVVMRVVHVNCALSRVFAHVVCACFHSVVENNRKQRKHTTTHREKIPLNTAKEAKERKMPLLQNRFLESANRPQHISTPFLSPLPSLQKKTQTPQKRKKGRKKKEEDEGGGGGGRGANPNLQTSYLFGGGGGCSYNPPPPPSAS